jgi:hypothetical protein
MPTAPMSAVVSTSNRRGTVVSLTHGARMTVDTDLACGWGARTLALRPGYVLLETKTDPRAHARLDLLLHRLGERPLSISKYCVGVAALRLGVPDNPWRRTIRRYFETSQSVPS